MNDLQRFLDLYASIGIPCRQVAKDDGWAIYLATEAWVAQEMGVPEADVTVSDRFDGSFSGGYTAIYFDASGAFVRQVFG